MSVIHSLKQKKEEIRFTRSLEKALAKILSEIELVKGDFNLDHIYGHICQELTAINIPSLVAIYDHRKNTITIKKYCPIAESKKLMEDIIEKELVNKEIPLNILQLYQTAFSNSYPLFFKNRSQDLLRRYPAYQKFYPNIAFNSIVAPLVLRGEIIGAVELFSHELRGAHVPVVNDFAKSFAKSIANIVLYQEIKKSEERYWDLFENAHSGYLIFDKNQRSFIEANKEICRLTGYTRDEFKQMNYLSLFVPEERKKIRELVIKEEKTITEAAIFGKNEVVKFIELIIQPTRKKEEILFSFNDVTSKKIAEEECRRLDELNRRILDTSPISITVLNQQGKIMAANRYAKEIMGNNEDLVGKDLLSTREIVDDEALKQLYKKTFTNGEAFHYDDLAYWSEKSKQNKHFNIVAVPLYDKQSKVEGAIAMAIDNTETVRAKEKLKELNRELEKKVKKRTEQLALINEELAKVLELKQKFISDASHELRTPLTVIQGNLDLTMQELENSNRSIPEIYELINKEVEHMTSILTDLTMLTNADTNTEKLKYEKIDLGLLTIAVEQSLRILAHKKNIKIEVAELGEPIIIMGDESKIEKALLNLVRNAIKYTDNDGKINIWIKKEKDEIKISVKDTGIGIPAKDLPYIFERFYRVDKARSRNEGGTGLGLSIAKSMVEVHGGRISVVSELGKGTTFTIHLPTKNK